MHFHKIIVNTFRSITLQISQRIFWSIFTAWDCMLQTKKRPMLAARHTLLKKVRTFAKRHPEVYYRGL